MIQRGGVDLLIRRKSDSFGSGLSRRQVEEVRWKENPGSRSGCDRNPYTSGQVAFAGIPDAEALSGGLPYGYRPQVHGGRNDNFCAIGDRCWYWGSCLSCRTCAGRGGSAEGVAVAVAVEVGVGVAVVSVAVALRSRDCSRGGGRRHSRNHSCGGSRRHRAGRDRSGASPLTIRTACAVNTEKLEEFADAG